jgi:hypothetical protein
VKDDAGMQNQSRQREHLRKLRDRLDLPFSTLKDDELVFVLADERHVVASYTETGHLSLICEIGELEALSVNAWRRLLTTLSGVHDYTFPASLVTVEGRLALIWGCGADMESDQWVHRAEDALTRTFVDAPEDIEAEFRVLLLQAGNLLFSFLRRRGKMACLTADFGPRCRQLPCR